MCNGCWRGLCATRWILVLIICLSYLFMIVECRSTKKNEIALPRQTVTLSPFLTTVSLRVAFAALLALVAITANLLWAASGILTGVIFISIVSLKTLFLSAITAGITIYGKLMAKNNSQSGSSHGDESSSWPSPSQNVQPPVQQSQYQPQHRHDYWRNERSEPYYDAYNSVIAY